MQRIHIIILSYFVAIISYSISKSYNKHVYLQIKVLSLWQKYIPFPNFLNLHHLKYIFS